MDEKLKIFQKLHETFKNNGFSLYLVGGTVRDYLLKRSLTDMDAVTDATPKDMEKFIPDANFRFAEYGSVTYKFEGIKFDITTLRKEAGYVDSRHPNKIEFVKDLITDVKRRDFTINGLYLDSNLKVLDFVGGVDDLNNRIIRMIGEPKNRLKEDPLRIIRALRFSIDFDFTIDSELEKSIKESISLLDNLNIDKIKMDIKKIRCPDKKKILQRFSDYNIKHLVDVIE